MEKRSFEGESTSGIPPKDPKDKPPGPLKTGADPSGESKDQAKEIIPPLARITDDEDDDSPPAHARRYMPQEQKIDDLEDLEPPPPEPVQEPQDSLLDAEFQRQASRRRLRRFMQTLVEGPCSLRPDSPNLPPLPAPVPYSDLDIGQQPAGAPDPGQQVVNAPNPREQVANAPARSTTLERFVSCYKRISAFSFQFPFHTLLLTWPLATVIMGVLNLKDCLIDYYLPYVMMVVGFFGTATVLLRLYVIYYEQRVRSVRGENFFWIAVRAAEFIIWVFLAIQLFYFFKQAPSFVPGEKNYCKPRFYKINCGLMFLSSATMIGWIVVNIGNFIYWFPRRNERPNT